MSLRINSKYVTVLTTVGAVNGNFTNADAINTIPNGSTCRVRLTAVGRDTGNGDSVTLECTAVFKMVAGTLTRDGISATTVIGIAALTGAGGTIVASGTNIMPQVVGVAAKTIEWTGFVELFVN
jgi:hypothetical protein